MSPEHLPCVRALDRECFRAHPEFARRALAYRLLHLLIPPDIARLLPKKLSDPLVAPGVEVPLGAVFPPGTVLVPGCSFPVGWDPEDEPPECAKSAPLPTLAMQIAGGNPSVILSPGEPGTGQVHPPAGPPPAVALCFDEPFNNLTTNDWDDISTGTGSATIVGGKLKLHNAVYADHSAIERENGWPCGDNFLLELRVKIERSDQQNRYTFYTGKRRVGIMFYETWRIDLDHKYGYDYKDIGDFGNGWITWLLDITGNAVDVYRDGNLVWKYTEYPDDASSPGRMWLDVRGNSTTYTDYIKITAK